MAAVTTMARIRVVLVVGLVSGGVRTLGRFRVSKTACACGKVELNVTDCLNLRHPATQAQREDQHHHHDSGPAHRRDPMHRR